MIKLILDRILAGCTTPHLLMGGMPSQIHTVPPQSAEYGQISHNGHHFELTYVLCNMY